VANAPAEITHLLEELQQKDAEISVLRSEISKRDAQLQKWVRVNGGHVPNPKEEAFSKTINDCFDRSEILQAEKVGLAERALMIWERQLKRFDVGLRGLSVREEFPSDWVGPSMLSGSVTGVSTPVAGAGGPLQPVSGNASTGAGAPNIANAAQLRLAQSAGTRAAQTTPTANMPRSQRESSTDANKRRRLNTTLGSLPTASSNLRQSSLGPGTPKAGTPGPGGNTNTSRAGSAQPTRPVAGQKKAGAPAPTKKLAPHQAAAAAGANRKRVRPSANKKGDRRRQLTRSDRATPSTNASASASDSESASPTPSSLPRGQTDGAGDRRSHRRPPLDEEDDDDDEENDESLYCYCQKVSFGNMVGCDNDDCKYQWFHWDCVKLKSEPEGEWLCPDCRKLGRDKLSINRD
jgi:inhibitor of growth protein 3